MTKVLGFRERNQDLPSSSRSFREIYTEIESAPRPNSLRMIIGESNMRGGEDPVRISVLHMVYVVSLNNLITIYKENPFAELTYYKERPLEEPVMEEVNREIMGRHIWLRDLSPDLR